MKYINFDTGGGGEINISNIICTNASNTPQGVTWTSGGTSITGTLVASASLVNNRYFVVSEKTQAKNIYKEYVAVLSNGSYIWEELGNIDVPASTYTAVYDLADPTHSTPYADVLSAFQAGKRIQVKYGEKFFPLEMVQAEDFYFVGIDNEDIHKAYTIICRSYGSWEANNEDIALKNDVLMKPASGTTGQVLKKTASGAEWADESENFVVTLTSTEVEGEIVYSANKSVKSIYEAHMAKKHCVLFFTIIINGVTTSAFAPLALCDHVDNNYTVGFCSVLKGIVQSFIGKSINTTETWEVNSNNLMQKGSNVLTQGHLLVTDSGGNVADSGKTTADLQDVIYGYMNNSTFYLTRTGSAGAYVYSDAVTPAQNKQYTDKEGNVPYIWDGSAYHAIGGGSTPQNEIVSFNISSSDGQASLTGQQIIINVSGQANPILITLDANGQGSATVALGTPYSVAYPAITGYTKPLDGDYIAMTNARSIVRTYNKIDLLNLTASVHVEESSSPLWTLGGNPQIVENILNKYGSYVIDEVNKKYARLSPADHSKFLDGTAWTGSYGNSFRRFPRVYYKFDTSTKILYISDSLFDDNAKHWDETWIGTYKGSVQSNILRSIPGVNTTGNMTMTAFWEAAQRQGGDYGLVNYFDHCLLNALHLCKYGNANSQQTMGGGLQDAGSSYYTHQTGTTKLLGDNTGSAQYLSTNFTMCKLFGIEDLAGSQWEFRPNIRFSGADCIVYEGNIVSNTAPGIRTAFSRNTGLSQSYIVAMALGEDFDLIPITGGGSSSSNWCDGAWSSASGQLLLVGGSDLGSLCGLSASHSSAAFSFSIADIGARLAFRGNISDYDLVTGSELAALH